MHVTWKHLSLLSFLFLLCTAVTGLMQSGAVIAAPPRAPLAVIDPNATVFINEIHYDNDSTDVGEFVEIAAAATTDLTGWSLVLYNGANGDPYGSAAPLSGIVGDTACGYGFFVVNYPSNGLQNGDPDGIALVNSSNVVVQFLSYDGAFAADMGVANGLTSTNIGVSEPSNTPLGLSLQLTGNGTTYGNFTWSGPVAATSGAANVGQTFGSCDPAPSVASVVPAADATDVALNANIAITLAKRSPSMTPGLRFSVLSAAHTRRLSVVGHNPIHLILMWTLPTVKVAP